MDYDTFLEFVKTRRTKRGIKPDPIPDDTVDKLVEAARWAPSGFNMQPWEFVVVRELELRNEVKRIIDDYRSHDFFALEATREKWQGEPWIPRERGDFLLPLAPLYILILGDTRSNQGLPMAGRFTFQKMFSIFDSTLSNAGLYMLLAAHSLGLGAHYTSATKYPKVSGLLKGLLNIPDYLTLYDMLVVGKSDMKVKQKMMRDRKEMIHYEKSGPDEFRSDEDVRKQIIAFRAAILGFTKEK